MAEAPRFEYVIKPPEIIVAENGYVLKTYDVGTDRFIHEIAPDLHALRDRLGDWADLACDGIRTLIDKRIQAATAPKDVTNG
jgi:hypothetical protein